MPASLPHKKLLAARLGVGHMLIVPFTRALANEEPSSFVESLVRAARPLVPILPGWASELLQWVALQVAEPQVQLLRPGVQPRPAGLELVDRARAETLMSRLARDERDAWVTWPARVPSSVTEG